MTLAEFDLFEYFQKTRAFIEDNLSEKNVIVEEGLDDIDIDDIGSLEDSRWLVFIDEECENLIVVVDVGELPRNVNQRQIQDTKPLLLIRKTSHKITTVKPNIFDIIYDT